MERLALESVRALAQEWPVEIVGPHDPDAPLPDGCVVSGVAYGSAAGFLLSGWRRARRVKRDSSPSLAVGGSGLAAPLVVAASQRSITRTMCFVHGLDLVVTHPVYRNLCLPALRTMDVVIANSRNTARLAERVGIERRRIEVLNPGVAIDRVAEPALILQRFPEMRGRRVLLSVGRLLPRKGIVRFVSDVLPGVLARHPDVLLVVAGDAAPDALTGASGEVRRLADAIDRLGIAHNVMFTGRLEDEELDSLYAVANLLVFPVRDLPGDVEGFGMVALEAAANGLPTVAFNAGGVADAVADGVSGTLVDSGDNPGMVKVIDDYLQGDVAGVDAETCRRFASDFAWPRYGERLRDLAQRQLREGPDGRA
jgi:phosphatidylinositol alpha-1,6-mannosyltransferase